MPVPASQFGAASTKTVRMDGVVSGCCTAWPLQLPLVQPAECVHVHAPPLPSSVRQQTAPAPSARALHARPAVPGVPAVPKAPRRWAGAMFRRSRAGLLPLSTPERNQSRHHACPSTAPASTPLSHPAAMVPSTSGHPKQSPPPPSSPAGARPRAYPSAFRTAVGESGAPPGGGGVRLRRLPGRRAALARAWPSQRT